MLGNRFFEKACDMRTHFTRVPSEISLKFTAIVSVPCSINQVANIHSIVTENLTCALPVIWCEMYLLGETVNGHAEIQLNSKGGSAEQERLNAWWDWTHM